MPPPIDGPRNTSASFSPAPMISPPMIAPGTEVKPPRISTGSAFSASSESENCTPSLLPHTAPADQRHQAGDQPDDEPDLVERNADRLGGGMVVGDGAQRAADARALEEQRQPGDQQAGDDGRPDVELVHQDAAVEQRFEDEDRLLGQADIERIDVGAEQRSGPGPRGRR